MPDDEALLQQQGLTIYRRTLVHLLTQAAQFGGEPAAPPHVANAIDEARAQIGRLKTDLRASGADIADMRHPDRRRVAGARE
jgi:hypothetical protein